MISAPAARAGQQRLLSAKAERLEYVRLMALPRALLLLAALLLAAAPRGRALGSGGESPGEAGALPDGARLAHPGDVGELMTFEVTSRCVRARPRRACRRACAPVCHARAPRGGVVRACISPCVG